MSANSLLLLLFIILSIVFLSLLALNIDLLTRFRFTKENWSIDQSFSQSQVEEINHYLNSRLFSEVQIRDVIAQCPVNAIDKVTMPKIHLTVSKTKCLGFSCSECLGVGNKTGE